MKRTTAIVALVLGSSLFAAPLAASAGTTSWHAQKVAIVQTMRTAIATARTTEQAAITAAGTDKSAIHAARLAFKTAVSAARTAETAALTALGPKPTN
jgi:hypothetical protein